MGDGARARGAGVLARSARDGERLHTLHGSRWNTREATRAINSELDLALARDAEMHRGGEDAHLAERASDRQPVNGVGIRLGDGSEAADGRAAGT